ncbi:beta/gamma crystallin domain-containing protein [Streptomyces sp. NPDC020965]|uniref:beta/gamma crystallin domain-containing protein n=1 Tax=Streptomyces sp. NPDC020965 TaxID=3365105 RepID=UPI00379D1601
MKLSLRRSLGVAAATMAVLAGAAVPAAASAPPDDFSTLINGVPCNQTDFLEIHNNNGQSVLCFANGGWIPVAIYGVNWVESGNNRVKLQFQRSLSNPTLESVTLAKWSTWNPGHIHKIIRIEIY